MYQFIYPWIHPEMFKLLLPETNSKCTTQQKSISYDADLRMAAHDKLKQYLRTAREVTMPTITANHTEGDVNDAIFYAADKFVQYIQSRETCVTFHGPNNSCSHPCIVRLRSLNTRVLLCHPITLCRLTTEYSLNASVQTSVDYVSRVDKKVGCHSKVCGIDAASIFSLYFFAHGDFL